MTPRIPLERMRARRPRRLDTRLAHALVWLVSLPFRLVLG